MMRMATLDSVIHSDPEILGGTPVFCGTRVPVKNLIDYLAAGDTLDRFLDDFPSVRREQAVAALELAGDLLTAGAHPPWGPMIAARLLVVLVLLAAPLAAEAQQAGKVYRIGYLGNSSAALESELVAAFRQGLRDLNYVEGHNIVIEYRWAEGRYDRFPALVAEAVRLKVDVIVTAGTPAALAAKQATRTIPIVIAAIADPIAAGLVPSLARPGGNVTGSASMSPETDGKRLELLKELVPGVSRIAALWNPTNPNNAARIKQVEAAARTLRLHSRIIPERGDRQDLDKAFEGIVAARSEALIVESDRALLAHRALIVDFAKKRRLPALYPYREFVAGRRSRIVRTELSSHVSARRHLRRQDPQGRQARRPARRAAHQVRAGHQPQDRQGPRPHDPAVAPAAGRSGDRVMDRRTFLGTIAGGLLAVPLAAEAQPATKTSRIGYLSPTSASEPDNRRRLGALREGLRDLGYVEGQNFTIESRWAEGEYGRLPDLAAELVNLKVDVIVTYAPPAIQAAKHATGTIPIVMAGIIDPVATGFVTSLARPGGNITGLSLMAPELVGKQLDILKQAIRKVTRVAVLGNPANAGTSPQLRHAQEGARALKVRLQLLEARGPNDLDSAFRLTSTPSSCRR